MKRSALPLLLSALLLLSGCGPRPAAPAQEAGLSVLATTYPVYVLASALTAGADEVSVQRLNTGEISCLHDYTLSVGDMKLIEGADVLALNGAGLENFMDDALAAAPAAVIDCSAGLTLLAGAGHEGHAHKGQEQGHFDPHVWMDPQRLSQMADNLAAGLAAADPEQADLYQSNAQVLRDRLAQATDDCTQTLLPLAQRQLITFHEGFGYLAQAFDFEILAAIEEEEGSEASAKEILSIVALVNEHRIPAIFTEINGSDATALSISRETGCEVAALSLLMSGPEATAGADAAQILEELYVTPLQQDIQTLLEALS